MKVKKGEKAVALFTLVYLIISFIYFLFNRNYEFLGYAVVVFLVSVLIATTIRKTNFDNITLWALSIWGLIHMLGGGVVTSDGVLYAWKIYPLFVGTGEFFILKFDQVVHFYGFGVAAIVAYHLLSLNWKKDGSRKLLYFFSVLISAGFGVLNEIIEFASFLIWPNTWVGDFYNLGLDLVFNTLGAIAAMFFIYFRNKNKIYS